MALQLAGQRLAAGLMRAQQVQAVCLAPCWPKAWDQEAAIVSGELISLVIGQRRSQSGWYKLGKWANLAPGMNRKYSTGRETPHSLG